MFSGAEIQIASMIYKKARQEHSMLLPGGVNNFNPEYIGPFPQTLTNKTLTNAPGHIFTVSPLRCSYCGRTRTDGEECKGCGACHA